MKKQSPRQSRKYWKEHLSLWKKSDLSQRAYCQQHKLKDTTFSYWKRKLTDTATEPMTLPPDLLRLYYNPLLWGRGI